jgi:hypothetical protein
MAGAGVGVIGWGREIGELRGGVCIRRCIFDSFILSGWSLTVVFRF